MLKFISILFFLISFSTLQSQNYVTYSNQFDKLYGGKNEVDITHLKRFGFHDVFKYSAKDFNRNIDSTYVLSKIRYASITISEKLDLDFIVDNLEKLPNLEYVKFKTPASLFKNGKVKNIIFPKNLYKLKNVKTISLKGDFYWDYSIFLNSISRLPKLENLILFYNNFPDKIFKNPNFLKLNFIKGLSYFGSNKITFPNEIYTFKNLTSLSLGFDSNENSSNEINKFSSFLNLKYLQLKWVTIDENLLKKFKSIKELSLSSSEIKNFEEFLKNLSHNKSLEKLEFSNNKLIKLPKEIGLLKNLQSFFSSNNKFRKELPNEFYNLKELKNIEIQGSEIEIISDKLNHLKKLESLKLYHNKISKLPKKIGSLSNLSKLYLNHNKITELPKDIGKLNLSYLSLNNNSLKELPNSFTKLKNLDTLMLQENYIKVLPKKIGHLKKLKYLNLQLNNFNQLPESISKLTKLEHLNISRNKIKYLPTNFGELSSLKILNSEFCLLKKLPKSFGNLTNLERLILTNNNLQELSENFGKLKNLKTIFLHNRKNYDYVFQRDFKKYSTISLNILNNDLTKLPTSFSDLPKLNFIELSLNKNINDKQLFNLLKKSKFKNYSIYLESCNIKNLPIIGWDSIKASTLNLSSNLITEIPKNMVSSSYLKSLNLNKNKGVNTYRGNRTQINLLFAEKGFINENEIPKTNELVIAYAKTANRLTYSKEYQKSTEYAEKAFKINKELTHKHLYKDNYIEALYYSKNYNKAILFADIQIQKDTSQNVRLLNSIIPNFKYKARSLLAIGDTINAIETFALSSKKFSSNSWTEAGMLSKKVKLDTLSKIYFNEAFKFYTSHLEKNTNALGYHLSLIEAYILANKTNLAKVHLKKLNLLNLSVKNYTGLISYFEIILDIIDNKNYSISLAKLKSILQANKVKLKSWSFKLIEDWITLNDLSKDQNFKINELNNLYK